MNDIDDDDIFYDAKESLSKGSPDNRLNFRKNQNPENYENPIIDLKRNSSVYEEICDSLEKKFSEINLDKSNGEDEISNLNNLNLLSEENLQCQSTKSVFSRASEKKQREQEKLRKLELMNEELKEISLDMEFLKKNLKSILTKNKGVKERHLHNLFELQNFQGDSQQIWVAKFSCDGRYLATGGKSGVLKIWEIYTEEESIDNYEFKGILSYLKLVNESAFRIYTEHSQDIIDICWSVKV
jgi:hypothetical protein